jgi:indolepyruvate ferredoxin oxidoreductase, beta subunit
MMKLDIILAGVGGQGILTIAAVIGHAAMSKGLHIKQAEVHGMSQRGGEVQSHLRISPHPIASDLIPHGTADAIIALEPMEALRYIPYLKPGGWVIANTAPFVNIPNYPPIEQIIGSLGGYSNSVLLDADSMAKSISNPRSANIILLGAAAAALNLSGEELEDAIRIFFVGKGAEVVTKNIEALNLGIRYGV